MNNLFDVTSKKLLVAKRLDTETFMIDLKIADEDGNSFVLRLSPEQLEEFQREIAYKKALAVEPTTSTNVFLYGIIVAQIVMLGYILFFI